MSFINPGALKHPIDFYENTIVVDNEGFKQSTQLKFLSTKCAITGGSIIDNKRSSSDNLDTLNETVNCIVRYDRRINRNTVVTFREKNYRIKNFENIDFENRFLRLTLAAN